MSVLTNPTLDVFTVAPYSVENFYASICKRRQGFSKCMLAEGSSGFVVFCFLSSSEKMMKLSGKYLSKVLSGSDLQMCEFVPARIAAVIYVNIFLCLRI